MTDVSSPSRDEGESRSVALPTSAGPAGPEPVGAPDMCSVKREGGVLRLRGEIDHANLALVTGWIVGAVRTGVMHLDLSEVSFCGAAGVRALLSGRDALPDGATLTVTCSRLVLHVLQICGLAGTEQLTVVAADARRAATPAAGEQ